MNKYKVEIKWAIIFFVVSLLWMVFERAVGLHDEHIDKHMIYTNFFAIPAILVFVMALLDKRKTSYGGKMTYKQGLMAGLIITAIVTILSPVSQYITSEWITPDYFKNVTNYSVETGFMTREAAMDYFNLKNYIIQSVIGAAAMGVVTSAIVAIFTRRS